MRKLLGWLVYAVDCISIVLVPVRKALDCVVDFVFIAFIYILLWFAQGVDAAWRWISGQPDADEWW